MSVHIVGVVGKPIASPVYSLIRDGKSVAGSHHGSLPLMQPGLISAYITKFYPLAEEFPLGDVNKAMKHLKTETPAFVLIK